LPPEDLNEKEIGHYLFFDKRLSVNGTKSCASCHDPAMAFTDGYHRSIGADGDIHERNSSSLINVGRRHFLTSGNSSIRTLEQQVQLPLFNHRFIELGNDSMNLETLRQFELDSIYQRLMASSRREAIMNWKFIERCLAAYCRSLVSRNSRYDRVIKGAEQFDRKEADGFALFTSARLHCNACHGGIDFDEPRDSVNFFSANGFFQPDASHALRKFSVDDGLFNFTKVPGDQGKFRVPTLRNCMLTAPYMHDGSVNDIDSVFAIYSRGGLRGAPRHPLISGFELTEDDATSLKAFLKTLTDTSYLKRPLFINPFKTD
jgi:cytochrome c peroxidase